MRKDDHEQVTYRIRTQGDKTLLTRGIGVFASKRELVFKNRDRVGKAYAVCLEVGVGFVRIPLVSHPSNV